MQITATSQRRGTVSHLAPNVLKLAFAIAYFTYEKRHDDCLPVDALILRKKRDGCSLNIRQLLDRRFTRIVYYVYTPT
jgi:hypothetical protein